MNLLLRFSYQVVCSMIAKPIGINEQDSVDMRVWPNDLDINIHLNNGRFLSLMDLGRTRLSIRTGLFKLAKKLGWGYGVVGGVTIIYLKSIAPFQKFQLKTKLAGHYNGWFYIEQRFEAKGKLIAAALVKVTFLKNRKRISAEEIIKAMNVDEIGENREYLEHLFNSETEFLRHVKKDY